MTTLPKKKIFSYYLRGGLSCSPWVTVSAAFPLCSPLLPVGRIQHLFMTFYYILLHSVEPTLGGVALVSLKNLDFHYVVKSYRQFLRHFNAGSIGRAKCKCNYSCRGSSTQIVWLFRGIIIQIIFTEIVAIYTNQSKCFPNSFFWSSKPFSLWSHNEKHLEWHPRMQLVLLRHCAGNGEAAHSLLRHTKKTQPKKPHWKCTKAFCVQRPELGEGPLWPQEAPHLDAGVRRWHSTDQACGQGAVRWMYLVMQGKESF